MNKKELRKSFRKQLSPQMLEAAGKQALEMLMGWLPFCEARCIAGYWPLPWELDTRPINQHIWKSGRVLCLPRVAADGRMDFYRTDSVADLQRGAYGLWEPQPQALPVSPEMIDLMLVPCEALDARGTRLGKGGGYYDRYLPLVDCPKISLLLPHQFSIVPLPFDPHDVPVDFYGIEGKVIPCERNSFNG